MLLPRYASRGEVLRLPYYIDQTMLGWFQKINGVQ